MRRGRAALALVGGGLVAIGVACSFPDVTFAPDVTDHADAHTDDATRARASDGGGAVMFVETGVDSGPAVTRDPDSGTVDPSSCAAHTPCDCDEDGYAALDCTVPATSITGQNGQRLIEGDCDDHDALRHPGQKMVKDKPVGHAGDWDCNGSVETDLPSNPPTTWCTGSIASGCSATTGIKQNVGCGEMAKLYTCTLVGVTCQMVEASPAQEVPRPCR